MAHESPMRLSELEALVVDCQATAAAPRGRLIEIGWAFVGPSAGPVRTCLVRLPVGERIPPAVARITGISERLMRDAVETHVAWRRLTEDAAHLACQQPAPAIIHFARFEQPFLRALAGGAPPFEIVCTHGIARRLLPHLPRRSLRALAGYFGGAVGPLRRCAGHVEATAFVWRELVRLLDARGISTWSALREWLAAPTDSTRRAHRIWPMPRGVRLALPDAPGVYRMLRTSGDVLYVGKASSLRRRVNSHFRRQSGIGERMLEMLSQARAVSYEVTESACEAALLEPDEIKRLRPPYNVALTVEDRSVWFTAPDLGRRCRRASSRCPLGPFVSAELLDQFAALAHADPAALGRGRWSPGTSVFAAGYARLCATHDELSNDDLSPRSRLLRLGTRLLREGRRDADADEPTGPDRREAIWTPEAVQVALEGVAWRAALARRRARWLTRLADSTIVWHEPGAAARLLVIDNGDIAARASVASDLAPPVPPGHRRSTTARRQAFTLARFDRLRVLTTELKRLVSDGAPVALRLGARPELTGVRLAAVLSRV